MPVTSLQQAASDLDRQAERLAAEAEELLAAGAYHGRVGDRRHAARCLMQAAMALRSVAEVDREKASVGEPHQDDHGGNR